MPEYKESILIVDDTEFMVKVLQDAFSGAGYDVYSAQNGEECLKIYDKVLPDLVTLDVVMPGMDGLATLVKLRRMDPSCKVIMVSAMGLEAKVMEAIRLGAKNYVLKPFDNEKVLTAVKKVLNDY